MILGHANEIQKFLDLQHFKQTSTSVCTLPPDRGSESFFYISTHEPNSAFFPWIRRSVLSIILFNYSSIYSFDSLWPAVNKRMRSCLLDLKVAGSSPCTASQFPHMAAICWPWTSSWKMTHGAVSSIKELKEMKIIYLPACFSACLFLCMYVCMYVCVCMFACIHWGTHVCTHATEVWTLGKIAHDQVSSCCP